MLGLRGFLGWDDAKALLLHICSCAHAVVQPRPPIQCCPHCRSCICLFNLFWSPSAFAMPVVPQCTGVRTASLHFRGQCCSSAPWTAGSTQVRRHYSAGTQAQKNVGVFLPSLVVSRPLSCSVFFFFVLPCSVRGLILKTLGRR